MRKVSFCSKTIFVGLMLTLSSAGNAQDNSGITSSLDPLDYYTGEDAKFSSHSALQAKACHALRDPIKIRFVVKDVDTLRDTIHLNINGSPVHSSIIPFKDGIDFNLPFNVTATGSTTQSVLIRRPGNEIMHSSYEYKDEDLYCFNDAFYTNAWENAGNGKTFGLHPIPKDTLGALGQVCRAQIKYSTPATRYYFNYDEPLDQADFVVQQSLTKGKKSAVDFLARSQRVFYKKRYLVQTPTGQREPSSWQIEGEETRHYDGRDSADINNTLDNFFPARYDGAFSKVNGVVNYDFTQRNINSIELTISERTGGIWYSSNQTSKSVFKWTRLSPDDEKTQNVLRLTLAGDANVITSRSNLLSLPEDKYSKSNFYETKSVMGISRGTLVPATNMNDAYNKYIQNTQNPPLSLPAVNEGDINLVNTEEIVIFVSKDFDSGKYSVMVYGQPLQFSDVYSAGKRVAPAGAVRNTCY